MPFDDVRVNGEEFQAMKDAGKVPYNQLPVLEVGEGTFIGQSSAILRYVGAYAGLYPTNDHVLAAVIDSLLDQEVDMFLGLSVSRYRGK